MSSMPRDSYPLHCIRPSLPMRRAPYGQLVCNKQNILFMSASAEFQAHVLSEEPAMAQPCTQTALARFETSFSIPWVHGIGYIRKAAVFRRDIDTGMLSIQIQYKHHQ